MGKSSPTPKWREPGGLMAFLALPPHPVLASLVLGYWFIEDLEGSYEGNPIRTTPHTAAVLTLNFGRPCQSEFSAGAPRASLLGVQSRPRVWHSGEGCSFVMVMLRPPGLARLFPATGRRAAMNSSSWEGSWAMVLRASSGRTCPRCGSLGGSRGGSMRGSFSEPTRRAEWRGSSSGSGGHGRRCPVHLAWTRRHVPRVSR